MGIAHEIFEIVEEKFIMKNFICGIGKIQNDFEYILSEIKVDGYFLAPGQVDLSGKTVMPFEKVSQYVDRDNIRIIVCDQNRDCVLQQLIDMGFKRGKNVFLADDFFYILDYDYMKTADGRPIAIWGTGSGAQKILEVMEKDQVDIKNTVDFFVDNNPKQLELNGIGVYTPKEIDILGHFVIVASDWYKEIRTQLLRCGLKENIDFVDGYKINAQPSQMLYKTIYDTPLKDNHCMWPFEWANIQTNGIYACGWPSWLTTRIGSEFADELDDVWNSNIAKVIRLSMLNHTYSFCEKSTCPYLDINPQCDETFVFDRNIGYAKHTPESPKEITMSFDDRCNLKCLSCRTEGCYHYSEELSETMETVLERIKKSHWISNSENIDIAGNGEIFFSEYYKKLIFDPDVQGKRIVIQTNGTLIKKEYIEELIKKFSHIEFYISIDAASSETFKKLRTGSWKQLIHGLEIISGYRKKNLIQRVRLSFVVQRDNYFEMLDFIELAKHYGFDWIYFSRIQNFAGWDDDLFWSKSMIRKDGTMEDELIEVFRNPLILDPIVDIRQFYRNLDISGCGDLVTNRKETVFFE